MNKSPEIHLFVSDPAVLSSLEFALAVEGFTAFDGNAAKGDTKSPAAMVVDAGPFAEGVATVGKLRATGCIAPAILLATNPTRQSRARAAAEGIVLIEKPLLGDDLSRALFAALGTGRDSAHQQ